MAREWQQTKMKEYIMPDQVYYQSLWAVRDLFRMEERKSQLHRHLEKTSSNLKNGGKNEACLSKDILNEEEILTFRTQAIRKALEDVPESYRKYILSNIIDKNEGKAFPDKFWRRWKQKFLYDVAKSLRIM